MSTNGEWFDKIKTKENPFEIFGLTGNPFPSQPIASLSGYDFNEKIRGRELEEIRDKFLVPSINGEATNLWVIGPLGVGKSSLMMHVKDVINNKFGAKCIAIYVLSPEAGITTIYRDFVNNFATVGMDDIVFRLARRALRKNPNLMVEKKNDQTEEKRPRETFKTLQEAIAEGRLNLDGVIEETKKDLFNKYPYIDSKIVELCMGYLRTPESIEDLRNVKPAEKLNALIALVHLINLAGLRMIYLFIDQLEMGWGKWTRVQKDRFAIDIRELVVRTKPLLSVEITCNEDIISDLETNYPQLLRPLPKKPHTEVYVSLFNFPEIKRLVIWYLDKKRKGERAGKLDPFEEAAIKGIYQKVARNTSEILSSCYGVLNSAALDKIKPITEEYAIDHLKEKIGPSTDFQ